MKKIIFILIISFSLLLLTGCSENNQNINNSYENTKTNYSINKENVNSNIDIATDVPIVEEIVSSFTTKIYDKNSGRMHNLRLASEKLTGIVVKSGETFSFNNEIGPYNKEKGFEKGKIFSSTGNVLEEYGGGICQISTTVYNAVLPLNVEIVERHKHSRKVQYIQSGKDATLSYGHLDFKFKNTLDYDIEFNCTVTNDEVKVEIKKKE